MSAHTPGPLRAKAARDGMRFHVETQGNVLVGTTYSDGDARLFAAAPELLAELRCVIDSFRDEPRIGSTEANFIRREWFARAVAAIAKAEGKS